LVYVVLDTNILVSALWSKDGNPAKVTHLIPDRKIAPCFCSEILNGYRFVLSRTSFHFPNNQVDALLNNIKIFGKAVNAEKSSIHLPDESDRVFYDTARTGRAILITGNTKHYPTEPFIMTPADFLHKMGNK